MKRDEGFCYHVQNSSDGFKNPLAKTNAPDPCIVYSEDTGYYYALHTCNTELIMYRSRKFSEIYNCCESKIVYRVSDADGTYGRLWAPELHRIDGKWYIYTSTREKETEDKKHLICLIAKSDDPFDGFSLLGHIHPELFMIDPTIYKDKRSGRLYLCSSFCDRSGQRLAIEELISPAEPIGEPIIIAEPTYDWELIPRTTEQAGR